jgi:hypothetical protein
MERNDLLEQELSKLVDDRSHPDWKSAACIGTEPEAWFPFGKDRLEQVDLLIQICEGCPIRAACLDYGRDTKAKDGVWGGVDFFPRKPKTKHRNPPTPPPGPSKVRGVSWDKQRKRWVVRIRFHDVSYFGGNHKVQTLAEQKAIALRKQIIQAWQTSAA